MSNIDVKSYEKVNKSSYDKELLQNISETNVDTEKPFMKVAMEV